MVDICLLGCGGMMPLPGRWLTALLYRYEGRMILIDCGEGTQVPLKLAGWGFKNIDAICFTHYHADHIAGLPGLLLTIGNSGRNEPLTLYGPPGLKEVVACLTVISPQLPYSVMLGELPGDSLARFMIGQVEVSSLPVEHWVPCLSYRLDIVRSGRFDPERAKAAAIPQKLWKRLQAGETVEEGDKTYTPEMVLGPPRKGIRVGYSTDNKSSDALPDFFTGSDLLICEGMYGDSALRDKASEKGHMVFAQAAQAARDSGSKELWLTHFSPALSEPGEYLGEATNIFANTRIGADLMKKTLHFDE